MTPDVNDDAVFDLGTLTAGTYTLTATAVYDTDGLSVSVSSPPLTFYVATFSVKTQSWSPNPAAVTQVVTGQAQAKFDPAAVAGSPYFVTYAWTTAGVWYSPDGTPGTFKPFGGNYAVGWQQGQATTQFTAQFFVPGQYLLEVQCVAMVYSVYNGSLIASYTNTGYVGGDASDIDPSGGTGQRSEGARVATECGPRRGRGHHDRSRDRDVLSRQPHQAGAWLAEGLLQDHHCDRRARQPSQQRDFRGQQRGSVGRLERRSCDGGGDARCHGCQRDARTS